MTRIPGLPPQVRKDLNWQRQALCVESDPEIFFPVGTSDATELDERRAKDVCELCEVRARCFQWAMNHGVPEGIWGGYTAKERRDLAARLHGLR
ncbi:WhiB family transcriptional regulator [Streptomyces sp. NPDC004111]|uniref:WhiB family transcriptional regulator n=1 Tax=Streptomyces sp. NPDC004111 TaxID=3364690 RepID=UPI003674FABD